MTPPEPGPGLDARLVVERGAFDLDLPLLVPPGQVLALLGPNGAGKSTALAALAGLVPLTDGHLWLGGRVLDDPRQGVLVPSRRRRVGMVFQDYLLFPHLSVLDNVAFGLRARGASRAAARHAARGWLERVGVADLAGSRPGATSGGQAQRVALARALAPEPRLLLLDEPLAALDAGTRLQVRTDLRHHLAAYPGPCVLVTHDPVDAMVLADRMVVLEHGRQVQEGTPAQVARAPRTDYVARLVGLNLLPGTATAGTVAVVGGPDLTVTGHHSGPVLLTFPPRAVTVFDRRPDGASLRNLWAGTVTGVEPRGHTVRALVRAGSPVAGSAAGVDVVAEVTTLAAAELGLLPGRQVWLGLKATEVDVHPG